MTEVDLRLAAGKSAWADASGLLFAYQRETAAEMGAQEPQRVEEVWLPVRQETMDPASVYSTYVLAYEHGRPVGGLALVAHDGFSVALKRCFVRPEKRGRGIATEMVAVARQLASDRGANRLVLDVLASRTGALAAWRAMGFVDAQPWGDPSMAYRERPTGDGEPVAWLGVPYREVVLRESEPRWAQVFLHQAEVLRSALADQAEAIEHVGSTAVPGLVAKPIVDVAVLMRRSGTQAALGSLTRVGYQVRGDKGADGGMLLVLEDRPLRRIVLVHLVVDDDAQWERYLTFRDRLRSDAEARQAYSAVKQDLARRFPRNRGAYTAEKDLFIRSLLP